MRPVVHPVASMQDDLELLARSHRGRVVALGHRHVETHAFAWSRARIRTRSDTRPATGRGKHPERSQKYQFLAGKRGNDVTYGMHLRTANAPAVVRVTREDKIACQCLDSLPRSRPASSSLLAAERRPPLSRRRRPSQAVWRKG